MLLFYYKLRDNIADERFFRRLGCYFLLPLAKKARRQAIEQGLGDLDKIIGEQMQLQATLEHNNTSRPDEAAEPTGQCLCAIMACLSVDAGQKRVLSRMGYLLGRAIYLLDALDDIEDDRKKGRYNPFLSAAAAGESLTVMRERAVESLNMTIGELLKTYSLCTIYRHKPILDNILELGLCSAVKRASAGEKKPSANAAQKK